MLVEHFCRNFLHAFCGTCASGSRD
jgi:hypothetical protein